VLMTFKRVVDDFNLSIVDFEQSRLNDDLYSASRYLLKYITKNLSDSQDLFNARVLDGWKRKHKIRVFSNSQMPLNVGVYKKIYYSLSNYEKNKIFSKSEDTITLKERLDLRVNELGTSIYLFLQDNLFIRRKITCMKNGKRFSKTTTIGRRNAPFQVNLEISKDSERYTTHRLDIDYENLRLYRKAKFIKQGY
jgi:hypothetical protein